MFNLALHFPRFPNNFTQYRCFVGIRSTFGITLTKLTRPHLAVSLLHRLISLFIPSSIILSNSSGCSSHITPISPSPSFIGDPLEGNPRRREVYGPRVSPGELYRAVSLNKCLVGSDILTGSVRQAAPHVTLQSRKLFRFLLSLGRDGLAFDVFWTFIIPVVINSTLMRCWRGVDDVENMLIVSPCN